MNKWVYYGRARGPLTQNDLDIENSKIKENQHNFVLFIYVFGWVINDPAIKPRAHRNTIGKLFGT